MVYRGGFNIKAFIKDLGKFILIILFIIFGAKLVVDSFLTPISNTITSAEQTRGTRPLGDVKLINKVLWNDVIVSYDDIIPDHHAKEIFKAMCEKHQNNLNAIKIDYDRKSKKYLIAITFKDNSQLEEIL